MYNTIACVVLAAGKSRTKRTQSLFRDQQQPSRLKVAGREVERVSNNLGEGRICMLSRVFEWVGRNLGDQGVLRLID